MLSINGKKRAGRLRLARAFLVLQNQRKPTFLGAVKMFTPLLMAMLANGICILLTLKKTSFSRMLSTLITDSSLPIIPDQCREAHSLAGIPRTRMSPPSLSHHLWCS
ncbi:hypothetical protein Krac_0631 [Ktedonobacter racemifer DSM 44963]|uniref:Uncharacterized protein n=1 Tax=Ktedonobacter racemifer DSM 44963 TaxID=485913 RepID=D6U873_KTERA|nr:hypothetical protein Krac_0631 [Ktedonobacter racemifer DSM 44963]